MDLLKKAEENIIKYDEENAIKIIEGMLRRRERAEAQLISIDFDLASVKNLTSAEIIDKFSSRDCVYGGASRV